jgi:hypothetical protein
MYPVYGRIRTGVARACIGSRSRVIVFQALPQCAATYGGMAKLTIRTLSWDQLHALKRFLPGEAQEEVRRRLAGRLPSPLTAEDRALIEQAVAIFAKDHEG